MKRETMEDFAIMSGLVGVQFVYAGNSVFMSFLMSLGIDPLTLVIFSTFSTFLIVSPVAVYFERYSWPKKLSLKLILQLVLISFGGVTLFQSLLLKGIQLTSPTLATAMPNLAPGLIFAIAWIFRLEKVQLSCIYSKIKILGTLLCVIGAFTMSVMHSASSDTAGKDSVPRQSPLSEHMFDEQKILGCAYLFSAIIILSSVVVLDVEIMLRSDKSNDRGGDYTRRRLIATCDRCGHWFDEISRRRSAFGKWWNEVELSHRST